MNDSSSMNSSFYFTLNISTQFWFSLALLSLSLPNYSFGSQADFYIIDTESLNRVPEKKSETIKSVIGERFYFIVCFAKKIKEKIFARSQKKNKRANVWIWILFKVRCVEIRKKFDSRVCMISKCCYILCSYISKIWSIPLFWRECVTNRKISTYNINLNHHFY